MRYFMLAVAVAFIAGQVSAQSSGYGSYGGGGGYYGPYGGAYTASTAEEGMANGFANVIRSAAQANLTNAQAATQAQDAVTKYLDNRTLATQTYFNMRQMNSQYRAAERGKPLSMEQYVRLAKQEAPDRMSPSQLDPFTGQIQWPQQLMGASFAPLRTKLEALYKQRALGDLQTYAAIKEACAAMSAELTRNIKQMAPMDFVVARNFVDSLGYEANFAMQ